MTLLDPKTLPHEFPRAYVPSGADLGDWKQVEPLFDELRDRSLGSVEDLKRWLKDWGEFQDCLGEAGSIRYVRMTCATDDPACEKAYLEFLERVEEPAKPRGFELLRKYKECPYRAELPRDDFFLFDRSVENEFQLYREENIPLETELGKLSQQYQKLTGSLMVHYDGREQTLQQMGRYLESTDRKVREEAWSLTAERRLQEKDAFEDLFDAMLKLRVQVGKNAGFENYRDYVFRRKERFDYSPKDCQAFHESAEKAIRPLVLKIQEKRAKKLGLSVLKPWDLSVDPNGKNPLKPFEGTDRLVEGCGRILEKVDPEFGRNFRQMRDLGLLDLDSRKGKAPGGYNTTLEETRLPFIFMNAVGLDHDVRTLLHESGHAMHGVASRGLPFSFYRHAPMEFCEVASMSMELMGNPYLSEFYPDAREAARSCITHLENVIGLLPWIATVDAFQHWIYANPGHGRQERTDAWVSLRKRLGGAEDWTGLEEVRASLWHRQLHIFELPFYYIEYGIAQLGALQVWKNYRKDPKEGVRLYKQGLSVGGSRTLPEIFKTAGIRFDFSLAIIEPLMEEVGKELDRLEKLA
ncbi:MAG TPA: M3 family oligoendopeptidase [bacterium]|nr:M3 family oligoendopeptidase [bacterium]